MSDIKDHINEALDKLAESSVVLGAYELEDSTAYTTATAASVKTIVTPKGNKLPTKAGYMVSVDGNSGPQKVHDTIELAKAEAERLSSSNAGKLIRILYLVGVYAPTHEFKELV